jgi:hypothetical protein
LHSDLSCQFTRVCASSVPWSCWPAWVLALLL